MKKSIFITSITIAGLALCSAPLFADADQPWHVSFQFGGVDLDSDRDTHDHDVWLSLGFGRFFGNHVSLDLEYDRFSDKFRGYNTAVPGATYDRWKLNTTGLMGRYFIGTSKIRPVHLAF